MVSKTWYSFIENQRGVWIDLMRKCFKDIPKKAHEMSVRRADGTKIQILIHSRYAGTGEPERGAVDNIWKIV